jgi:hypothetical protein
MSPKGGILFGALLIFVMIAFGNEHILVRTISIVISALLFVSLISYEIYIRVKGRNRNKTDNNTEE